MKNHTGTHVLNFAIRQLLPDADQKGSLVAPDRMRFDFTAKSALTTDQVKSIEQCAQKISDSKQTVYAKAVPLDEAKTINGLRAVFEEVVFQ